MATRAADVSKLWHQHEPRQLRSVLPSSPEEQLKKRRLHVPSRPVKTAFGMKMLAHWGPAVLTSMQKGTVLDGLPEDPPRPPTPKPPTPLPSKPSDEFTIQRAAFQAEATHAYRCREFVIPPPKTESNVVTSADQHSILDACMSSESFQSLVPQLARGPSRVIVWGDGSASLSENRAGSGVFYGYGNPRNTAHRCPGDQTNNRAELYAFLWCIQHDSRPLLYVTDSLYVHDGVQQHRHKWRARAWFRHPLMAQYVQHADLWQEVDISLRRRAEGQVVTCWSRGHAHRAQADAGQTTLLLTHGNVAADWLAGQGAKLP
eukprot:gene4310-5978_t